MAVQPVENRWPIAKLTPSNGPASSLPIQLAIEAPQTAQAIGLVGAADPVALDRVAPEAGLIEAADPVALEARAAVAEAPVRSEGVEGIAGLALALRATAVPRAWAAEAEVFAAAGDVGADERALVKHVMGNQTL
jgi:hypothetical protein